jgi:hypothetical protein
MTGLKHVVHLHLLELDAFQGDWHINLHISPLILFAPLCNDLYLLLGLQNIKNHSVWMVRWLIRYSIWLLKK